MKNLFLPLLLLIFLFPFCLNAQWTNGQDATFVIGQPDFTSNTSNNGGLGASSLANAFNAVVDNTNNKLYVVDGFNNRVLRYSYPIADNMPAAEAVLGQQDFNSNTDNYGGIVEAYTMSFPTKATVGENGTLWVADAGNRRVLRFDNAHLKLNGAPADGVLGQPDFNSNNVNNGGLGANTLHLPVSICIGLEGRIWVADFLNNRVLRFDNAATKTNGAPADGVLGQPDFNSNTKNNGGIGANTMFYPASAFEDTAGNLWVADGRNNRVLKFEDAANLSEGASANVVLGQTDFISNTSGLATDKFNAPLGTFIDGLGKLYVQDGNNRILIFDNSDMLVNGASANSVLGQPDFTTGSSGTTASKFSFTDYSDNLFVDFDQNILWVGDNSNNRILGFQASEDLGPDIAPIPTLGQWGIIILLISLMIAGTILMKELPLVENLERIKL